MTNLGPCDSRADRPAFGPDVALGAPPAPCCTAGSAATPNGTLLVFCGLSDSGAATPPPLAVVHHHQQPYASIHTQAYT